MNQATTVAEKIRQLLLAFLTGRKQHGSSSPAHPVGAIHESPLRGEEQAYGSTRPVPSIDSGQALSLPKGSPRAEQYGRVARAGAWLALALFILAMPTFLVTTNVRWAFNDLRLYRFGFEQHNVVSTTGLDMTQLMVVARDIRDYFSSSQEFLDVRVVLSGEERPLFNQGEILHMRDVKVLVRGVLRLQEAAGAYIIGYLVIVLLATSGKRTRALAGRVMVGSLFTVGLLAFGGLAAAVGFDRLFEQFHFLSFSQGTFTFDPRYNYLTRLFTEGFFLQGTLFIAVATILEATAMATVGWGVRRWALNRGETFAGSN